MPMVEPLDYGAHWWVPGTDPEYLDRFPTMFAARGFGGQRMFIVPELDTVLLVLSNNAPDLANETIAGLVEAFAGVAAEPG
jgi:CubicO group peptidase (beta-lactamase class C family)